MGAWEISLAKELAKYTQFITRFGQFHLKRLRFGINSAPEHFQHLMAEVREGLEEVLCHINDLLV